MSDCLVIVDSESSVGAGSGGGLFESTPMLCLAVPTKVVDVNVAK